MGYGNRLAQGIYARCGPGLRSLFVSIYSRCSNRAKYGDIYRATRREIADFQWLATPEQMRLAGDLANAYGSLADRAALYYRRRDGVRSAPAEDRSWRSRPLTAKADVRADQGAFLNRDLGALGRIHRLKTSGTTGAPLSVLLTNEALQREYAYIWDFRSWHGCRRGERMATIAGHPVVPVAQNKPPFWVYNRTDNQLLFSSYHMSAANLPRYVETLRDFSPVFLTGFPSSLALIGAAALDMKVKIRPRAIFFASETMQPHHRSAIRDGFGINPRLWYGNTELAGHIVECQEGRLHVREDHSLIEFLAADGTPAAPGSPARLIVTSFHNRAMFFVRYEIGDSAELSAEATCPCGRGGRLVANILGRLDDTIIDGEGRLVTRLGYLFKNTRGLADAQILQNEPGAITIRLVADPSQHAAIEAAILAEARQRLAASTRISFDYVDSLARTAGGKTRLVVSNLRQPPPAVR